MLFRHRDCRRGERSRNRAEHPGGTDAHQHRPLGPIDRRGDASRDCVQIGQPRATHHVLRDYDVIAVGHSQQKSLIRQTRQLRARIRVRRPGVLGTNGSQRRAAERSGERSAVMISHGVSPLSMQILGY